MIAGIVIGVFLGAAATGLVTWWHGRKRRSKASCATDEAPVLLEDDRAVISDQFAAHAEAVRRQVAEYADTLAGGDEILREQLRPIEIGMQS